MADEIKYDPEFCDLLVQHMDKGYSFESFGAEIGGVDDSELDRWVNCHSDFKQAKKFGHAKCLKFWEKLGMAGMSGNLDKFDREAWMFAMKNLFMWDRGWTK